MLTKQDFDAARVAVVEKLQPTEQEKVELQWSGITLEDWGKVPSGTEYQFWRVLNTRCNWGVRAHCYVFNLNGGWTV